MGYGTGNPREMPLGSGQVFLRFLRELFTFLDLWAATRRSNFFMGMDRCIVPDTRCKHWDVTRFQGLTLG